MSEKPITVSPYSIDPFETLLMTDAEIDDLYCNRADELFRPYTVIDVITKVYNRSFIDDLKESIKNDQSILFTLFDIKGNWKITAYWINEFRIKQPESVFSLRGNLCPVDIAVDVRIRVQGKGVHQKSSVEYRSIQKEIRLRYIFDFTPCHLACNYAGVILNKKMCILELNPDAIRMNKYLLPVLRDSKDYEYLAREIIKEDMPEFFNSSKPYSGMDWLEHMHLKVFTGKFEDRGIMGEYFFGRGTAEVYDLERDTYVKGYINPGSIVLNVETCETNGMVSTTAAHEGTHHRLAWYYFMLQRCHGKQISSYLCKRFGERRNMENGKWSPNDIMELHANKLPGYILIQTIPGKKKAKELLASYGSMRPLDKMKRLVDDMADYYGVTKTMTAHRLYDFGYHDVNGMTQYIDGRKIPCYLSNLPNNKTYTIDEKDAVKEYLSNPKFRKIIDTGLFEYVEGHYCLKTSKYICIDQFGFKHLTYYAREHMSDCCLVFEVSYSREKIGFIGGVLHKGDAIQKQSHFDSKSDGILTTPEGLALRKKLEQQREEMRMLNYDFNSMTKTLIKQRKFTVAKLAEETGLSIDTINDMKSNSEKAFKLESVIAVCIAMHLPAEVSIDYIKKAPCSIVDTVDVWLYKYAIMNWSHRSVADVNRMLQECGAKPLTKLISDESIFIEA